MLIPYEVNVLITRWPITNFVVIGICILIGLASSLELLPESFYRVMVLDGWSPLGMFGHMFLHADFFHLLFNMLALYIFGNAICARIGNGAYLAVYLFLGFFAAAVHNVFEGGPCVGASGAINGIIGMYLVLYPQNKISCLYFIFFKGGTFDISGFWLIGFWLLGDIWGAYRGGDMVAYWAHLGGFLSGFAVAFTLVYFKRIKFLDVDNPSLVTRWTGRVQEIEAEEVEEATPTPIPMNEGPLYYIHSNNQQLGPYPKSVIIKLVQMGQFSSNDLFFDDQMQSWLPVEELLKR
jgi:membrane associated rhomboid family serine protease